MNEKILIIEDEEGIRRLLRYDLKQLGYEVESAKDGREGLEMGLTNTYDVILIDWMLPYVSGLQLISTFREKGHDAILFMLTAKDEEVDILEAFEAGVDDYLTKPFSPRVLSVRIQAHLRRIKRLHAPQELSLGSLTVNTAEHRVMINNEKIELTKKEFDLLTFFIQNENIVLSRDQILNEIWDYDYDGDTRIVDVHVFKLRMKLETSNVEIQSMRGVGYVIKRK